MLTPTVGHFVTQFYPLGNTPAVSLTRNLPHGVDADILLLGCGDLRNIFYTAYMENGLLARKMDITCCDTVDGIIARNTLLLSLLTDDSAEYSQNDLWSIYYDLFLPQKTLDLVKSQAKKLIGASTSLGTWHESKFGRLMRFCDAPSLASTRALWTKYYAACTGDQTLQNAAFKKEFQTSRYIIQEKNKGNEAGMWTGYRAITPMALRDDIIRPCTNQWFWQDGSVSQSAIAKCPNPLFSESLSYNSFLHYGTDPTLGFHLAASLADLRDNSPLKDTGVSLTGLDFVGASKKQFAEWISAFQSVQQNLTMRFAITDALTFCHTLQAAAGGHLTTANLFSRQFDTAIFTLDPAAYGTVSSAPKAFDVIDTSNLADTLGTLNLIVAAMPLLKRSMVSTLYTETMLHSAESQTGQFHKLLGGNTTTVSLLLGVSCLEYLTNSSTFSDAADLLSNYRAEKDFRVLTRLSWKLDRYLSGRERCLGILQMSPEGMAKGLFQVYLHVFENENPKSPLLRTGVWNTKTAQLHRGSFAAFIRYLQRTVDVDWATTYRIFIAYIANDKILPVGSAYYMELVTQLCMNGGASAKWLQKKVVKDDNRFTGWGCIPPIIAVTLVVPRDKFSWLYQHELISSICPTLNVGLRLGEDQGDFGGHHMFADLQVAFGSLRITGDRDSADFKLHVEKDKQAWLGKSPLIVSFYAPTPLLQLGLETSLIRLEVLDIFDHSFVFPDADGFSSVLYETSCADSQHVYLTEHIPGQTNYPMPVMSAEKVAQPSPSHCVLTPILYLDSGAVVSLRSRHDVIDELGRALLEERQPVETRQLSPFCIGVSTLGKLFGAVDFPMPVTRKGCRMRVARRKKYWVEITAPLANPKHLGPLGDFLFPVRMDPVLGIPTAVNIPHLNLDRLPLLDVDDKKSDWVAAFARLQLNPAEMLRRHINKHIMFQRRSRRVDFKDTVVRIFNRVIGHKGVRRCSMFTISHGDDPKAHFVIFVWGVRLDGGSGSVVADAAVLPLTPDVVAAEGVAAFLHANRRGQLELRVRTRELVLWKRALPAMVERCRTWAHGPDCEYGAPGAAIPLGLDLGRPLLCSCGCGDFPPGFRPPGIDGWDAAAAHMTRFALSPAFSTVCVGKAVANAKIDRLRDAVAQAQKKKAPALVDINPKENECHGCLKVEQPSEEKFKFCARCKTAKYCSAECQLKDWPVHKKNCVKA